MPIDEDFIPDDFSIQVRDTGQLRLVWERDSGERRAVVLDRQQLPAVLRELQKQTEVATSASTDLLALLAERVARVTGLGFVPQPDNFRLTAFVDLPEQERGFAISLQLSRADVRKCLSAMGQWIEGSRSDG